MTFRMPSWPDFKACMVEVLVVSGCPGTELALARVKEATEGLGVEANLRVRIVDGVDTARELRFTGSPTVRVDGADVEEGADAREPALSCRLYDGERAPPTAWIRRAIAASVSRLAVT